MTSVGPDLPTLYQAGVLATGLHQPVDLHLSRTYRLLLRLLAGLSERKERHARRRLLLTGLAARAGVKAMVQDLAGQVSGQRQMWSGRHERLLGILLFRKCPLQLGWCLTNWTHSAVQWDTRYTARLT